MRGHRGGVRLFTAVELGLTARSGSGDLLSQRFHFRLQPCHLRLRRARQERPFRLVTCLRDHVGCARAAATTAAAVRVHEYPPLTRATGRSWTAHARAAAAARTRRA